MGVAVERGSVGVWFVCDVCGVCSIWDFHLAPAQALPQFWLFHRLDPI